MRLYRVAKNSEAKILKFLVWMLNMKLLDYR